MTTDQEFAEALADALGPLYRVRLLGRRGSAEKGLETFEGDEVRASTIALPNSSRSIVLELNTSALDSAERVLRALSLPDGPAELPSGTFTHVDRALDELLALAEAKVGRSIGEMSRSDKQRVVYFLEERGAFALRKSVETVADALGVSRFTVYNYLDSARDT
jgi:predicted transcriptional regulator YheO